MPRMQKLPIHQISLRKKKLTTEVSSFIFDANRYIYIYCIYRSLCDTGSLDPKKVKGKIVVCLRGENSRVEKSFVAAQAGAVGMILCNTQIDGDDLFPDAHFIPSAEISYKNSLSLFKYMNSTTKPTAYITNTYSIIGVKPNPSMASFSSAGPFIIAPDILKVN